VSGPTVQDGATWLGIIATIGAGFLWVWRQIKKRVDDMFASHSNLPQIAEVRGRLDAHEEDAKRERLSIRAEIVAAEGRAHADVQTIRHEVAEIKSTMASAAEQSRIAAQVDKLVFHLLDKADR